jgi:hypothetical protein
MCMLCKHLPEVHLKKEAIFEHKMQYLGINSYYRLCKYSKSSGKVWRGLFCMGPHTQSKSGRSWARDIEKGWWWELWSVTIDAAQKKMLYLDFSSEFVDLAPLPASQLVWYSIFSISLDLHHVHMNFNYLIVSSLIDNWYIWVLNICMAKYRNQPKCSSTGTSLGAYCNRKHWCIYQAFMHLQC